jgi:hypothetical protein
MMPARRHLRLQLLERDRYAEGDRLDLAREERHLAETRAGQTKRRYD